MQFFLQDKNSLLFRAQVGWIPDDSLIREEASNVTLVIYDSLTVLPVHITTDKQMLINISANNIIDGLMGTQKVWLAGCEGC